MGYTVYGSNPDITGKAGFSRVARIPCIFDGRPGYDRMGSSYLIDRGLGVWHPVKGWKAASIALPRNDQTMLDYAYLLANFLEWASIRGINLLTCNYAEHVHGRYQKEMVEGIWSQNGAGLSPQTVNQRVQQACDFLSWMVASGHRPTSFDIPYDTVYANRWYGRSAGHRPETIAVRQGKVRQDKRRLRMPTDNDVKAWLADVHKRFGYTKGLMCENILKTAVRREEDCCWRTNTVPECQEAWHINTNAPRKDQRVLVDIKFGAKGHSGGRDHGDNIGPKRSIWIPLDLAERLDDYRRNLRNPALKRWVKSGSTLDEQRQRIKDAVHLFLDEKTGERITGKALYAAWTGVELPFKGWSPKLGRHWWACSVLWLEMKKHEHLLTLGVDTAAALLESTAMSIIRLQIQPQLGHVSDDTTMIYLEWISDMLGVNLPSLYEEDLEHSR